MYELSLCGGICPGAQEVMIKMSVIMFMLVCNLLNIFRNTYSRSKCVSYQAGIRVIILRLLVK